MYSKNLLVVMVDERWVLIEKAFLSPFCAACNAIPYVALSHRIVTAFAPAFSNSLEAAALRAMRPSVVTDNVGLSTLTAVLSNVLYAIFSAPYNEYAVL